MPSATKNITASFGGKGFSNDLGSASGDGEQNLAVTLPVGKLASAWVKTDADTAACNLAASHGIVTGKVDVYFAAGSRYGVDAIVTVNAIALDGGTGTDFPASAAVDVVIAQQVTITFPVVYSVLKYLALVLSNTSDTAAKGSADIQTSGPASIVRYTLTTDKTSGGLSRIFDVSGGDTNPLSTSTSATIRASQNSTTYAATLYAYALTDVTP